METLVSLKQQTWLPWFLKGILIVGFLILTGRLIELQIIKGSYYRALAEGNRIRRVALAAPRGKILARGGEILAGSNEVVRKLVFSPDKGFTKSDDIAGAKPEELITESVRRYPLGSAFAHVSGYLGEVNDKEVGKVNPKCPEKGVHQPGDLVGRSGLEEQYQCALSGVDGEELVEVNTQGRQIRILGRREPVAGKDLKTWIDFGFQQKVAESLGGKKGAVIVTDPNGEVLALYSSPSFDPNLFIDKTRSQAVERILTDKDLPLFNRAISGQFHPGSVFKPVVVIAALSEGAIDKNYTFDDPGVITIDKYSYANWYFTQYGRTEGTIGLTRAIARSTDTFFYKIGELIGIEKIAFWADKMGMNKETGIDLPGEIAGLVPTPEWKKRVTGEAWFLGNTYHVAIGQGDLAITPIEENQAISAFASGRLCSPRVSGEPNCVNLKINKEDLDLLKQGMIGACSPGGTGFTFFDWNKESGPSTSSGRVACKTGTAETSAEGISHAWFTAFSPTDFPDIVVTVLVERGGEGSKVAGPIARSIFDYRFAPSP